MASRFLVDEQRLAPAAWALALLPGIAATAALTAGAYALAELTGLPLMVLALALGIGANALRNGAGVAPGIDFSAKHVLRLGVALLGAAITIGQVAALGWATAALAMACVAFTIAVGLVTARALSLPVSDGLLFGGASGICGASAALAIATVLPQTKESEARTLLAVIGVTALSTIAMVLYPMIAAMTGLDDTQAGIFLGATIHDVAQVAGAGFMLSEHTGETATIVKLTRVACLVPVVALIGLAMRRYASGATRIGTGEGRLAVLPWFLVAFIGLALAGSTGLIPTQAMASLAMLGKVLLVFAIVALGWKTSLADLARIGIKPVLMLLVPTVALAGFALLLLVALPDLF